MSGLSIVRVIDHVARQRWAGVDLSSRAWAMGAVLTLTLLAGVARWQQVAHRPLWIDEACTWRDERKPIQMVFDWRQNSDHPPLSYLLDKISTRFLGTDAEWALRLPSFLAGLACIPAIFWLGCELRGRVMGLVLAVMMTGGPLMRSQGEQARMYTMLMLAAIVCLAMLGWLLRHDRAGPGWWALWGLWIAAALWASLMGLVIWAALALALGLWWIGRVRGEGLMCATRRLSGVCCAAIVALAACQMGLVHLKFDSTIVSHMDTVVPNAAAPTVSGGIWAVLKMLAYLFGTPSLSIVLIVLGLVGLLHLCRRGGVVAWGLAGAGVLNLVAAVWLLRLHPFMAPRYLMIFQLTIDAGFAWLVAALVSRGRPAWVLAVTAGLCAVLWLAPASDNGGSELGRIARAVGHEATGGDAVVFVPQWTDVVGAYYGLRPRPWLENWVLGASSSSLDVTGSVKLPKRVFLIDGDRAQSTTLLPRARQRLEKLYGPASSVRDGASAAATLWCYKRTGAPVAVDLNMLSSALSSASDVDKANK